MSAPSILKTSFKSEKWTCWILQREQKKKNNSIWNQPLSASAPTASVKRPFNGLNECLASGMSSWQCQPLPIPRFWIDWIVPNAVATWEGDIINGIIGHNVFATIENDIPRKVTPTHGDIEEQNARKAWPTTQNKHPIDKIVIFKPIISVVKPIIGERTPLKAFQMTIFNFIYLMM